MLSRKSELGSKVVEEEVTLDLSQKARNNVEEELKTNKQKKTLTSSLWQKPISTFLILWLASTSSERLNYYNINTTSGYWTVTCFALPSLALGNKTLQANSCSSLKVIMRKIMQLLKIMKKKRAAFDVVSHCCLGVRRRRAERGEYKKSWAENKHQRQHRHKTEGSTPGLRPQKASEQSELKSLTGGYTAEKDAHGWPS